MIEVFNEISTRMTRSIMFYSEMADLFDFLSLHGLKRVMETLHIETICERRGLHRYALNHLNRLIKENDIIREDYIDSSWYSHVRADVDTGTRKKYLAEAVEKWVMWESETKKYYEARFKVLTDNAKIAEADKINELIECVDKKLKCATRLMLDYKAVSYDANYVMYDQKELHEKYEKRLKDGCKVEMC